MVVKFAKKGKISQNANSRKKLFHAPKEKVKEILGGYVQRNEIRKERIYPLERPG